MKINKNLNIDLNIISPQRHIRIHEGDVDSVDILIGVTVDDESVDLTGVTIKYDATINNYLAEQDADGSVVNDKISIPITQNMTAMSGLLLIDVRMIQNDQILFTQTICATVEKAVVNGSTYIDFDKITIIQRMNALEDKMDYIEELVENFDTSKLIVSANRPPSGAPPEVDVDLLRVGDTWILSGDNIVYKLVEARYNYSPAPGIEPQHYFTWQPLNERFWRSNLEPPTSKTYQSIVYTINEVQWSWLPVPEYFQGDHYQMRTGFDDPTYYICKSAFMPSTGVYAYTWREEGGSIDAYTKAETNELLADKMDLAPLNPTAEEIKAMPNGQIYGDTVKHKGVIKGGQKFYDTHIIDDKLQYKQDIIDQRNPIPLGFAEISNIFIEGYLAIYNGFLIKSYGASSVSGNPVAKAKYQYWWARFPRIYIDGQGGDIYQPIEREVPDEYPNGFGISKFVYGDIIGTSDGLYVCRDVFGAIDTTNRKPYYQYTWEKFAYTKTEIDQKGFLTLDTLPIYDGTVI